MAAFLLKADVKAVGTEEAGAGFLCGCDCQEAGGGSGRCGEVRR